MKTIGFIGAFDKTNLAVYVARLLVQINKKVMVVDATTLQKARYIIPTVSKEETYITEFEGIDIAVGFQNYSLIKEYLGMPQHAAFDYDYILVDVDSKESLENFDLKTATKNYFITGFDAYSLKRGLEIVSEIAEPMQFTKVLFSKNITKEEDKYLNYLTIGSKAIWDETIIYFPLEKGDQTVMAENERISKIKYKKLTKYYKESLIYLVQGMVDEKEEAEIVKAFKQIEKGV